MGLFEKLAGFVGTIISFGGPSGPTLTASGTRITASGNVAGADPVASTDFVTLEYGNANYGGSGIPQVLTSPYTVASNTQIVFLTDLQPTNGDLTVLGILQGVH
jgi:hypothetical protein